MNDIAKKYNGYAKLPKVVAHRGASGSRPENTLASFYRAKEVHAPWLETDAQLTKDAFLVIHHDMKLGRTVKGLGFVYDYLLKDLIEKEAGSWFALEYADQKVLSLEMLFEQAKKLSVGINLELKCEEEKNIKATSRALVDFLRTWPSRQDLLVSSFNHDLLFAIRTELPSLRLAPLYTTLESAWKEKAKDLGAYSVHTQHRWISKELCDEVKTLDFQLMAYVINSSKLANTLLHMGLDSFCTDFPEYFS